jgi:hypothetical protein
MAAVVALSRPASAGPPAFTEVVVAANYEYVLPTVVLPEGSSLILLNAQATDHDVVSDEKAESGLPLFAAAGVCCSWTTVAGVPTLPARDEPYPFHCSIHPWMKGALLVTSTRRGT